MTDTRQPGPDARWEAAMLAERGGDAVAYAAFLGELAAHMRRVVGARMWRLGQGGDVAEDVVQEILIAVHARRRQWNANRPLLPWLNAIARYKVIDASRRLQREGRISRSLTEREWADLPAAEPLDTVAEDDVGQMLDRLPAGQRAVVHAVAVEGVSHGDAARRLGMNEGSVRVAFHRGLKRLRKLARRQEQE